MALSEGEILGIVNQELANSSYISQNMEELRQSLSYYLGAPNGTEVEGRSKVTSTDVADSIEWIMPQVMKSFTQNNEIVIFDPVHEGDEVQAELESEFVYDILMKRNNGFVAMHAFIKDALMQRNGILKVYVEEEEKTKTEEFSGLTQIQVTQLSQNKDVKILSAEESFFDDGLGNQIAQYAVKIAYVDKRKNIKVDTIPLEEFRVNANHNSIDLSGARFTAHVVQKSLSEVRQIKGVTEEMITRMTDDSLFLSAYRFTLQGENFMQTNEAGDESERLVSIAECYMRMDIDEVGISKMHKITCAGIMNASAVISTEEIEEYPWISTTGILMSHKFQGLSIYDRLKQIQDQKTALIRNIFDNIYLTNNQRTGVIEGQVKTDDLLVSRPGGIVRMKRPDAIFPITTPQLGDAALNMVNYLDSVRAGRTGVSAEGNATPEKIGERIGSEGLDRLMNAKEELVGLMIRVIAETGIKPLCIKIRNLANTHLDTVQDFKFRGVWQQVNPTQWKERSSCTVRVGTGTGNQQSMLTAVQGVMAIQEKLTATPGQALTNPQRIFDTLDLFCKLSGLHGANRFFIDPKSQEGQQVAQQVTQQQQVAQQQQMQLQQAQLQLEQQTAQSEQVKAQAAVQRNQLHAQIEQLKIQLANKEQQDAVQIANLQQELEHAKFIADAHSEFDAIKFEKYKTDLQATIDLAKIEADAKANELNNFNTARSDIDG